VKNISYFYFVLLVAVVFLDKTIFSWLNLP